MTELYFALILSITSGVSVFLFFKLLSVEDRLEESAENITALRRTLDHVARTQIVSNELICSLAEESIKGELK